MAPALLAAVLATFVSGRGTVASRFSSTDVEVMNLTAVDPDLRGFRGGFASGDYGYLVPHTFHKVARFSLSTFDDPEVLDLSLVDPELKGFHCGFASDGHGYLVPWSSGGARLGRVARFSLTTLGDVETLDLTAVDPDLKGFGGGFASAGFGYLVPYDNGAGSFGKVTRFNLSTFDDIEVLDVTAVDSDLMGFRGGFASAGQGYLVPHHNGADFFGKVTRFSLRAFGDVESLDLAAVDSDLIGFFGGFSSAGYGYVIPYLSGKVARFSLATFGDVEVLDLAAVDPELNGFRGGFASAGHGYVVPYDNGVRFGKVARFRLATFSDVEVLDLTATDSDLRGFMGGFSSSEHGYAVPFHDGAGHSGQIARFRLPTTADTNMTTTTTTTTTSSRTDITATTTASTPSTLNATLTLSTTTSISTTSTNAATANTTGTISTASTSSTASTASTSATTASTTGTSATTSITSTKTISSITTSMTATGTSTASAASSTNATTSMTTSMTATTTSTTTATFSRSSRTTTTSSTTASSSNTATTSSSSATTTTTATASTTTTMTFTATSTTFTATTVSTTATIATSTATSTTSSSTATLTATETPFVNRTAMEACPAAADINGFLIGAIGGCAAVLAVLAGLLAAYACCLRRRSKTLMKNLREKGELLWEKEEALQEKGETLREKEKELRKKEEALRREAEMRRRREEGMLDPPKNGESRVYKFYGKQGKGNVAVASCPGDPDVDICMGTGEVCAMVEAIQDLAVCVVFAREAAIGDDWMTWYAALRTHARDKKFIVVLTKQDGSIGRTQRYEVLYLARCEGQNDVPTNTRPDFRGREKIAMTYKQLIAWRQRGFRENELGQSPLPSLHEMRAEFQRLLREASEGSTRAL